MKYNNDFKGLSVWWAWKGRGIADIRGCRDIDIRGATTSDDADPTHLTIRQDLKADPGEPSLISVNAQRPV